MGSYDAIFRAPQRSGLNPDDPQVKEWWPSAAIEAFVVEGAGHCLNLEPTAPGWFDAVHGWLLRSFGANSGAVM
jgi:hypothetical protein